MKRKTKQNIALGTVGTLALAGLALKRKAITSHIRNIKGKAVRVKGSGLLKPKSETVEKVDLIDKTRQLSNSANIKANTAKIQQKLSYYEEQSPFIKLTKSKRERANEIKRISKQYPYPFSRFVGLIEFARTEGAKDKQPRKKRGNVGSDIGLTAAGVGAIGLEVGSRRNLNKKREAYRATKMVQGSVQEESKAFYNRLLQRYPGERDVAKGAFNAIPRRFGDESYPEYLRAINKKVATEKKALNSAVKNRNLAKMGAIGLAGLSALELGRRGIKKYRNRTKDMS